MKTIITNTTDLENSKWMQEVQKNEVAAGLEARVHTWLNKIPASGKLAERARQALNLFVSGRKGEVLTPRNCLILGAALLYLVCPIDAVSDFVPVIGLLDDLGVLTLALNQVLAFANATANKQAIPAPALTETPTH